MAPIAIRAAITAIRSRKPRMMKRVVHKQQVQRRQEEVVTDAVPMLALVIELMAQPLAEALVIVLGVLMAQLAHQQMAHAPQVALVMFVMTANIFELLSRWRKRYQQTRCRGPA